MTLSDDYIAMQDDPWRDPYLTDEENVSPVRLNRPKPSLLVTEIGKKLTSEMKSQWESDVRNATVDVDLQSMFDSLGLLKKFREFLASHGTAIAKLADKICARDVLKGMWFTSDTGTRRELVRFIDRYLHLVMDELAPDVLPFDIINHNWRSIFDTELMPGLLVGYPDRASVDENRRFMLTLPDIYMLVVISGHGLIDDSSEGKDMEKMCACVRGMWAVQFTRAFIPALYIDDDFNVTLYVFTRGRLLRTVLGSLVDTNKDTLISLITPLAFHLLQTEHFGRFCNWYDELSSMRLTHRTPVDTDSTLKCRYVQPVDIDTLIDASDSNQDYFLQFPCHKPGDTTIFGPLNTLILSNVDRIKKLLLFSWYPKSSRTWGTVGGIEDAQSARLIPRILDCGIIVEDLLGYRLEFISFVYSGEDTDLIMKELLRLRDRSAQTMVDQHGDQTLAREERRLSDRSDVSGSSTEQHAPHHKVPRHH